MPIVVGFTPTPEGEAAVARAVVEARAHGQDLLVLNVSARSDPPEETFASDSEIADLEQILTASGVPHEVRQLVRGKDPADEVVEVAQAVGAEMIVIGLRHRSPVGKLLLGSNSQRILLEAGCPVLAVKAAR